MTLFEENRKKEYKRLQTALDVFKNSIEEHKVTINIMLDQLRTMENVLNGIQSRLK